MARTSRRPSALEADESLTDAGHASPSVTLGTYAHAFAAKEHAEETRDRMEAAFGDVLG